MMIIYNADAYVNMPEIPFFKEYFINAFLSLLWNL